MITEFDYLVYIPEGKRTEAVCLRYLKKDPVNIRDIPAYICKKLFTSVLAKEILRRDFETFKYIPKCIFTRNFIQEILDHRIEFQFDAITFLKYAPKSLITLSFCKKCVELDSKSIDYLPKHFITKKLWKRALEKDGMLIKKMPISFFSESLVLTAISQNPMVLKYIPSEFKTRRVCREAIKNNERAYKFAPPLIKLY